MATATPGGIASSIEAHATKLDAAIPNLAGTQAAVMGPDDRNPLIESRISSLVSALSEMKNSPLFKSDAAGEAVAKAIQPIVDEPEMLRQFALAICTTQDEDQRRKQETLQRKSKTSSNLFVKIFYL